MNHITLKLTEPTRALLVNIDAIAMVEARPHETLLYLISYEAPISVVESFDTIRKMIESYDK